jgi:hypothetical protein
MIFLPLHSAAKPYPKTKRMHEFDNLIENYQVNCAQLPDLIHHSYQLIVKGSNQVNYKQQQG